MKMDEIKASCSKLTELLYKLREQKSSENVSYDAFFCRM